MKACWALAAFALLSVGCGSSFGAGGDPLATTGDGGATAADGGGGADISDDCLPAASSSACGDAGVGYVCSTTSLRYVPSPWPSTETEPPESATCKPTKDPVTGQVLSCCSAPVCVYAGNMADRCADAGGAIPIACPMGVAATIDASQGPCPSIALGDMTLYCCP